MHKTINQIKTAFEETLPGREAQYAMAHAFRGSYPKVNSNVRQAGVLILLYPKQQEWHVVFIQRPNKNPNDRHAGQLSFPGGKVEKEDANMEATALRETDEEIGVNSQSIDILGPLTNLYIPVSNFLVSPFVGYVDYTPTWTPQESEVDQIIEFPLASFLLPETKGFTDIKIQEKLRLQQVPFFNLNGKILWGATAMMLNEFLCMSWTKGISK